jgi:glutamate 5-kinase
MHELQAAAAVGQSELVHTYELAFGVHGLHCAQILLTHADLANRQRYLNARNTLNTLLELGVIPIINENDTVATEEIRFGDNDNLAALVANIVDADVLVVLTDQEGLYTADPRVDPAAELVHSGQSGDHSLLEMAGEGSILGRGGMQTKLLAAEKAALSGTHTLIVNGRQADVLARLRNGEIIGTMLRADNGRLASRKQWLAMQMRVEGILTLDEGAVKVLLEAGRSLLAVGVTGVEGDFARGELVSCVDPAGNEIARGLSNYSTVEVRKIMGQASEQIAPLLGYAAEPELIHRNNLVLI